MSIIKVTDKDFQEIVLKNSEPILCDFWAEWCGPCKQISPILAELSDEYSNKIKVAKINIDENPEVPSKYGIMSIPTLILFSKGKLVSTQIGLVEKETLKSWLDQNL